MVIYEDNRIWRLNFLNGNVLAASECGIFTQMACSGKDLAQEADPCSSLSE